MLGLLLPPGAEGINEKSKNRYEAKEKSALLQYIDDFPTSSILSSTTIENREVPKMDSSTSCTLQIIFSVWLYLPIQQQQQQQQRWIADKVVL